jgi:hypothetical protein
MNVTPRPGRCREDQRHRLARWRWPASRQRALAPRPGSDGNQPPVRRSWSVRWHPAEGDTAREQRSPTLGDHHDKSCGAVSGAPGDGLVWRFVVFG